MLWLPYKYTFNHSGFNMTVRTMKTWRHNNNGMKETSLLLILHETDLVSRFDSTLNSDLLLFRLLS